MSSATGSVGEALFDSLTVFRSRLIERVREVNAMTEKEVMGAAEEVNAIFAAASDQIARLRELLSGASGETTGEGGDDLTALIDTELKLVGTFASELNAQVSEQLRLTQAAEHSLSGISAAAAQVGNLANRAKMLALNARIEASRLTKGASGFAVIADEMKELSRGVAQANASIQELARTMETLLPGIVRGANLMHERSRGFSSELGNSMRKIAEQSDSRRQTVARAVAESDQTLSTIVSASRSALSHLQFQDAVAQGLMRLDGMLRETQLTACSMAGLEHRRGEIAPAMHVEIGGDKAVAQKQAGQVMLF
jgi:methyl-accepting chemotaxis protein